MRLIDRALAFDNLRTAWEQVAANWGVAGVDGVSIIRWGRDWEANLYALRRDVVMNQYRPLPVRRFRIRKAVGGVRILTILTVTDRVLQRAVLNVLEPVFERKFLDCSYGYRPGRGVGDAVERIVAFRDKGFNWVFDADIDDCFPSFDHGLLRAFVAEDIDDADVRRLIDMWLVQMQEDDDDRCGIALGAVISPLLCNIFLHRLDVALVENGYLPVRYADDFVVMCHTERHARRALLATAFILRDLKLKLEPNKTQLASFAQGFEFLGVHFYRDMYSYLWRQKRVEVKGKFVRPWQGPDGYE